MVIPALVMGAKKFSLDRKQLFDYHGAVMAETCQMPGISINKIINDQRNSYVEMPIDRLVSIIKNAGEILVSDILEGESFQEYIENFTCSTGLPLSVAKRGLLDLSNSMMEIDKILEREVPEHRIHVLDEGIISDNRGKLALSPFGKVLGIIAPSNHPSVHISWITALAMKYSIIVKPGKDDPFTPYRVMHSLLKAGLYNELISMLPTEHECTAKLVDGCDKVIFYGTQKAIELFRSEKVIPRSAGNSKVFVDLEGGQPEEKALNISAQSVVYHGGRRCTNASSIVVMGDAERFAYSLAEMVRCKLLEPIDEKAVLGCFKSFEEANDFNRYIEENLNGDRDISGEVCKKSRLQQLGGLNFLTPTVLLCKSEDSFLYGKELPFPFVTVVKASMDVKKQLSNSLAITLFTENEKIIKGCAQDPNVGKVILNAPTYTSRIGEPHDGFLFNSLYRIKSFFGE
ncbi:MAG: aldehyde dehydrogenase family protein [Ruminiclostridium sp.]